MIHLNLFIFSSKTCLKLVLLDIENIFASPSLGHSDHLEENYSILTIIHKKLNPHPLDCLWCFAHLVNIPM